MSNTTTPKTSGRNPWSRPTLLGAAALVLIVGLGLGALAVSMLNNNDDGTELDTAAQANDGAEPTTAPTTGDPATAAPTTAPITGDPATAAPTTAPTTGDPATAAPTTAPVTASPVATTVPTTPPTDGGVTGVVFGDTASADIGTVKKATLSGPETGVLVVCDQSGFGPFLFTDNGTWVGCQLTAGATAGGESTMTAANFAEVESDAGGTVGQITIPGPQESVIVECAGDFAPFLFTDQGTWIGCQASPVATTVPTTPPTDGGVTGVVFGDTASADIGTVKKATLSGPETGVLVVCDQSGFGPFLFTDNGTWVGCQLTAGATAGGESTMTAANFAEVESDAGGTVGQITIPGPQESVIVECAGDFAPFLFTDQGTWIGCQG